MFTIIGELINSTRDPVKKALKERNGKKIRKLTRDQWEAGAEIVDVNAGEMMEEEVEVTGWLIDIIQDEVEEIRLALDTAKPEVMEAGLRKCNNRPVINSVNNKEENEEIRKLASEAEADVIGLAMGERGMPEDVEGRLRETEALLDKCENIGIEKERFDCNERGQQSRAG